MPWPGMSSMSPATVATTPPTRSADDLKASHREIPTWQTSPCASSPGPSSVPVLARAESCPSPARDSLSSAEPLWRSQPNFSTTSFEPARISRLPSCCENAASSFEPPPPQTSRRHSLAGVRLGVRAQTNEDSSSESTYPRSSPPSLATLRLGMRAKKVEDFVHARAAMKQRLVEYRTFCEQQPQPEDRVKATRRHSIV
ncbi:hypothetical protein T484DRAFT_3634929 [Baffinella frigidus]|nr:hypothetical protein T484DRAFT_3634929 [Cryptophyta sp. CCMP2293]